jgi:hypothetical protein
MLPLPYYCLEWSQSIAHWGQSETLLLLLVHVHYKEGGP